MFVRMLHDLFASAAQATNFGVFVWSNALVHTKVPRLPVLSSLQSHQTIVNDSIAAINPS